MKKFVIKVVGILANNAGSDQTAPWRAVWSGPTLFAQVYMSQYLEQWWYSESRKHSAVRRKIILKTNNIDQFMLPDCVRWHDSRVPVLDGMAAGYQQNGAAGLSFRCLVRRNVFRLFFSKGTNFETLSLLPWTTHVAKWIYSYGKNLLLQVQILFFKSWPHWKGGEIKKWQS